MTQKQAFPCKLVSAQEQGAIQLEMSGNIKKESLKEVCGSVFEIVPTCDQKIKPSDTMKGKGTLICSVCGNGVPLDFSITLKGFLEAESSIQKQCPHCNSIIRIVGLSTENEDENLFWFLVMRETQPASAIHGTFQVNLEELNVIPYD
jgi:hypothetical protein